MCQHKLSYDEGSKAVTIDENRNARIASSNVFEKCEHIVGVLLPFIDVSATSLGLSVPAKIERAERKSRGGKMLDESRVSSRVLADSVNESDDRPWGFV
jgi:hypothetical protein